MSKKISVQTFHIFINLIPATVNNYFNDFKKMMIYQPFLISGSEKSNQNYIKTDPCKGMRLIIWHCKMLKRDKAILDSSWMIGTEKINLFVSSFSGNAGNVAIRFFLQC